MCGRWCCRIELIAILTGAALPSALAQEVGGGMDDLQAFVRLSPRDVRYLELSNGHPYIPIGPNLVGAPPPEQMAAVVEKMAANRVNYIRLWVGQGPLDIEPRTTGDYDEQQARNLDRALDLCARHGIRVKMCLEYFRDIPAERKLWSDRPGHHVANGGLFTSMADFLTSERGLQQFRHKLAWYQARYGDQPAVFAWELWNEMNCVNGPWEPWTVTMLAELHRLFPRNLAVQSLGSFDNDAWRDMYRRISLLPGNDLAQVHRYLDLGAPLEVCHGPMDIVAADAVRELLAFQPGKPVVLAESGAVEPRHTGPFKLFAQDKDGLLLHDVIWAPFFTGAAGAGQIWWWQQYVETNDLWWQYARFAKAVEGLDPPAEGFRPTMVEHPRLRVYVLQGSRTTLAWCRDTENDWRSELQDGKPPDLLAGQEVDLAGLLPAGPLQVRTYDPWADRWADATLTGSRAALPDFRRSTMVRCERE